MRELLEALPGAFAARIGLGRAKGATRRFAFNAEFSPTLRRLMEKHDPPADALDAKLREISDDLESAKGSVKRNLDMAVDRGQKLSSVNAHSEVLADAGEQFRLSSAVLHRQAFWQSARTKMAVTAACTCILVVIVLWMRR